jgi:hypothetical protein
VAEHRRDHPPHVEALLAAGQATAEVEVVDVGRVERRHLVERGTHDRRRQVVRTQRAQRALAGAADRGAGGGDDDGVAVRHGGHALNLTGG